MTEESYRIAELVARRRGTGQVRAAGVGTEFAFFVSTDGEGYRVPRSAVFRTLNNPGVAAGGLQEQEWRLTRWAREQGVPTAGVIDLIQVEGLPVLVVEVVADDGSVLDGRQFGRVVARLHQAPAPAFVPVAQQRLDIADRIAARLVERHGALKKYGLEDLPATDRLAACVRAVTGAAVLNHLDLRRQNVRCLNGEVKALFDWSNALIAPAEVELARLTEYAEIPENGLDLPAVLAGYREAGGSVRDDSDAWAVLRLDAAVMLANVFDQVAPDPDLRDLFVERARGISL